EFLRHYYAQAEPEALDRDPAALAAAALDHLRFAAERKPGTAKLRVFNPPAADGPGQRTVIETVNDDMPFLVDSLTMALSSLGLTIDVTIHPLLYVTRTARGKLT